MGTVRAAGVGDVTPGLRVVDVSISPGNRACCRYVSRSRSRRDRAAAVAKRRGSVIVRYGSGGTPPQTVTRLTLRARRRSWGSFCRRVDRCRLVRRRKERGSSELPVERLPIGEDSLGNQFGIDDAAGLLRVEVVGSKQVAPTLGGCVPVDQHGVVIAVNSGCQFTVGG